LLPLSSLTLFFQQPKKHFQLEFIVVVIIAPPKKTENSVQLKSVSAFLAFGLPQTRV